MREIKFRAWNEEYKDMEYIEDFYGQGYYTDFILTQCTGLRDKYGKEIYEDDIIKTEGFFIQKLNRISVVKWSETGGYWMAQYDLHQFFLLHRVIEYSVIIGNRFENPGLCEIDN